MKTLLCLCCRGDDGAHTCNREGGDRHHRHLAGEMNGPNGGAGGFQLSFTFKQDGAKLTGTVQGPQGDPIAISDGKIDGEKISFKVVIQGGMTIIHEGTINAASHSLVHP